MFDRGPHGPQSGPHFLRTRFSSKLNFETSNCFEIDGHTVHTVHTVDFEALLVIGGDAPQSGVHVLHAEIL